ncbi:MAG TPA: YtxH domain-containing protein [Anaerolineales bacterium]|nr:YtxH domain-containing protein [Anaerolineales bacterium]
MKTRTHELENVQHQTRPVKNIVGGFLVGSVIGVATALLFAPRSGEETRAEIRDKAVELRDRTSETVKDTVSQAKSKAYEIKDTVTDTVREKAEELKQRGKHTVNRQLDNVSEAAETGKQKVKEY